MKAIIELSKNAAARGEPPVPFVIVRVQDRYGTWAPIPFRIDTGASVSAIPISLARLHGIGFQQHTAGRVRGLVGVTVDLFAGIGGFRIALQKLGGKCLFSSEWNCDAKQTYYQNFGEIPFGNLRQFTKSVISDQRLAEIIPNHPSCATFHPTF